MTDNTFTNTDGNTFSDTDDNTWYGLLPSLRNMMNPTTEDNTPVFSTAGSTPVYSTEAS